MKKSLFVVAALFAALSMNAQDKQLLYEKDWANVEYSEWLTADIIPDWTYEATDEGLVITNPHIQDQWWHPLVQCGGENDFSLEEGHDYFVRLTMKVPSDGIYKVVLGDWSTVSNWYVGVSETPSEEWQEIDVEFSDFFSTISNALVYLFIGDVVGTTILKKVQVYEKLKGGETSIKTVTSDKADDAIYNLAGQRIDSSYKGIVIQNGKKRIAR